MKTKTEIGKHKSGWPNLILASWPQRIWPETTVEITLYTTPGF